MRSNLKALGLGLYGNHFNIDHFNNNLPVFKGFLKQDPLVKNKLVQNVCHVEKLRALLPRFLSSSSDINVRGHACVESNTWMSRPAMSH